MKALTKKAPRKSAHAADLSDQWRVRLERLYQRSPTLAVLVAKSMSDLLSMHGV